MIPITKHTRDVLLEVAKKKKIYVEGNFLKILQAPNGDVEFEEYLKVCKEKDSTARRKRLQVTKQVQKQNKELVSKQEETDALMEELQIALESAKQSEEVANQLKEEAEKGMGKALEDLELMQKKTQFELISTIVKVALYVIIGVGVLTTVMYGLALLSGTDTQIIGSTWSNMFGIYTYYDILSLPFDRDINYPNQIQSKVDFRTLREETQNAILTLPIIQFTGDFKAGGLDNKQRLYLMSKMNQIYFVDTLKTNYAKCVTQLINVPDLSDKEVIERTDEHKSIQRILKSQSYRVTYNEIDYVIEITDEDSGTFTSIKYGDNFVMDYMLEKDILEYFYKNK